MHIFLPTAKSLDHAQPQNIQYEDVDDTPLGK